MSLCLVTGGKVIVLAITTFTLSWTHSVQKTQWREAWTVTPAGLSLSEAAVQSSGAGMEPGPDAKLQDGWWVWTPGLAPIPSLSLAASGATGSGWTFCHDGNCRELAAKAGQEVELHPCP